MKGGDGMVKRVFICSLPEGTDPDQFWDSYKAHATDVMRQTAGCGLKKYTINRVTGIVQGAPLFWGMSETWWESEEAAEKAFEGMKTTMLPNGKTFAEDFWGQICNGFSVEVEEFVARE